MSLRAVGFGAALTCALSCADLPKLAPNACGNSVVDPNEDCDTFATIPAACFPASGANACRFSCTASAVCPASYGCGVDGVCRQASGRFQDPLTFAAQAASTQAADFDGDQRADVVSAGGATTRIVFFGAGDIPSLGAFPVSRGRPAVGSLTTDGLGSLAVATTNTVQQMGQETAVGGGIEIWRGSPNRSLVPTIFPAFVTPWSQARLIPAFNGDFLANAVYVLADAPMFGGKPYSLSYNRIETSGGNTLKPMFGVDDGPNDLAAAPFVGRLPITTLGCDSIVLPLNGRQQVPVFSTCKPYNNDPMTFVIPNVPNEMDFPGNQVQPQTLSFGDAIRGPIVQIDCTRLTTDPLYGVLDLVAATQTGARCLEYDPGQGAYRMAVSLLEVTATPLAMGHLDYDNLIDWVDARAIHFSVGPIQIPAGPTVTWTRAVIDELNGNFALDVVALGASGLDFFSGAVSSLPLPNRRTYSFDGSPREIAIGDYDGDLVRDIVVSVRNDSSGLTTDALYVMFGRLNGYPEEPRFLGRLPGVQQIVPALVSGALRGVPDSISSALALTTSGGALSVAALQGSADRQMSSPFSLNKTMVTGPPLHGLAAAAVIGRFADPAHNGIVTLASDSGTLRTRLWWVPVTGDAVVDPANVFESPVLRDAPFPVADLLGSSMAAVDLDPPAAMPREEIVFAIPGGPGAFGTTRLDTNNAWSVAPLQPFSGSPEIGEDQLVLATGDFDGDGSRDVALLSDEGTTSSLRVILNPRNGRLDATTAIALPLPGRALSMCAIQADADAPLEIVVINHTIVGDMMRPVDLWDWDPVGKRFTSKPLFNIDGRNWRARSADVNGDGVQDLIVASDDAVQVHLGIPVPR